ncbi:NAD(P)/FAD-dependent oxidoreductase [Halorubellus salinus]|uniref:NAD(P)/FAD-dependent oxidoreductase n=1 Tax=Halorubellus salinus TaxID=755309 RepID=UPI001D06C846|nr:FAD-binding oxidoreductase [Halorubellus salinus]
MTRSVAVLGAGALGATVAFDLAFADEDADGEAVDVTLFEAGSVADGSTGRAAGVCYNAFAEDVDAEIGARAIERFRTFDEVGEFEFHESPYVWLAREGDDDREHAIREQLPRMQQHGVTAVRMETEEFAERFPSVRSDDVAVAAVAGAAGYTTPASYARTLAVLAKRQGADLHQQTPASVETDPLRVNDEAFDDVVVATGAHTKRVLADAGYSIAMKPYRVQAATYATEYDGPMVYDATDGFYLRPHVDGLLVGNGTEEREADPDGYDRDANDGFAESLQSRASERTSAIEDARITDAWAGLCTATPDRDPLVGALDDGLYVGTGFQGHGFMRAPAIGESLAEQVLGEDDGIDPFDPTRFTGDEEFDVVEGMLVDDR